MSEPLPSPRPGLSVGELVCWTLAVLGTLMWVLPFALPDAFKDWNGGQYAMVLVGILISISSFICTFLFRGRRSVEVDLFAGRGLLAHWTYPKAEWESYAQEDFARERSNKWQVFRIVAGFCVVIGAGFAIADWEGGRWVLGVLLGLSVFIAGVILVGTERQRKRRLQNGGEVRIGEDGLWLAGELHVWKGFGGRFESCAVVEGAPPCIEFVYSTPAKNQRQYNSVRVPIRAGRDEEAAKLVTHFFRKYGAS